MEARATKIVRRVKRGGRVERPVGTVVVRTETRADGRSKFSMRRIKVRMDGRADRRWKPVARDWWERNKGPVPDGMRVVRLDGDTMNDDPANLALGTSADMLGLWHMNNPKKSERGYAACRAATAEHYRSRGRLQGLRAGTSIKYTLSELQRFIKEQEG